jgi:hypothetical protein
VNSSLQLQFLPPKDRLVHSRSGEACCRKQQEVLLHSRRYVPCWLSHGRFSHGRVVLQPCSNVLLMCVARVMD